MDGGRATIDWSRMNEFLRGAHSHVCNASTLQLHISLTDPVLADVTRVRAGFKEKDKAIERPTHI